MAELREVRSPLRLPATFVRIAVVAVVSGFALAGCAWLQNMEADDTEQVLSAAGFQMKPADTPEKLAHLQTLTQRKLVPHERDGRLYYVYADANHCKCLYVGTEQAYQRYQKFALEKQIANEQREAAQMNMDAAMDWNMWGPWGTGGFGPW
jgi:hypothetical protein